MQQLSLIFTLADDNLHHMTVASKAVVMTVNESGKMAGMLEQKYI